MKHDKQNLLVRFLALLLCTAMILPLLPAVTFAAEQANVSEPDKLISATNDVTIAEVKTETPNIRYQEVTTLKENGKYVIMNKATKFILAYDSIAKVVGTPNPGYSLKNTEANPVDPSKPNVYYMNTDGNRVYVSHDKRGAITWIVHQQALFDAGNKSGTNLEAYKDFDDPDYKKQTNMFGGTVYGHIWLNKPNGTEWNPDGTLFETRNAFYGDGVNGKDLARGEDRAKATQFRFIDLKYPDRWMKTYRETDDYASNGAAQYKRYIIEKHGTDGFLVYWRNNDGTIVNFLTCDASGNWMIKKYDDNDSNYPNVPGKNSDALKPLYLRFFEYNGDTDNEGTSVRPIKFVGKTNYTVSRYASVDEIVTYIENNILLTDTNRRNLPVASSGAEQKIGYYYLKFDTQYIPNTPGQYGIKVCYCNDPQTNSNDVKYRCDTEIATLTLNVLDHELAFSGTDRFYVDPGVTKSKLIETIKTDITVSNKLGNQSNTVSYAATATAGYYWLDFGKHSGSTVGYDHAVQVKYRRFDGTDVQVKTLRVIANEAFDKAELPKNEEGTSLMTGIVMLNASRSAVVKDESGKDFELNVTIGSGENAVTVKRPVSVGMLTKDGKVVDTSKEDTYTGLTLTYGGKVITDNFTLKVTKGDRVLDYPAKGEPGYVGVNKEDVTTESEFGSSGVANINLSATGIPQEKGVDIILIMDLSGSMRYKTDAHEYVDKNENWEESRIYALEQSLKEMVKTLQESGADVRVAMSNFGDLDNFEFRQAVVDESIRGKQIFDVGYNNGSRPGRGEFANHLNFIISKTGYTEVKDGNKFLNIQYHDSPFTIDYRKYELAKDDYTGYLKPSVYTGSKQVNASAFVPVTDLYSNGAYTQTMTDIIEEMDVDVYAGYGTNYDVGLEYGYYLGYAIQQENIAKGKDRDIICVFMSDGAPMQYNYFSGSSHGIGWPDWITGRIEKEKLEVATTTDTNGDLTFKSNYTFNTSLGKIETALMSLLKSGKLIRYGYGRDPMNITVYEDVALTTSIGKASDLAKGYYVFRNSVDITGMTSFYEIMHAHDYDLDWAYLCEIAKANGIENFDEEYYRNDPNCQVLLDLFKDKTYLGREKVTTGGELELDLVYKTIVNHESDGTITIYVNFGAAGVKKFNISAAQVNFLTNYKQNFELENGDFRLKFYCNEGENQYKLRASNVNDPEVKRMGTWSYTAEKTSHQEKLYKTKLINPSSSYEQYYAKYTGTQTDFFAAMKEVLGYDLTWDMFAEIAWANCESLTDEVPSGVSVNDKNNTLVKLMYDMRMVSDGYTHRTFSPYSYFYNAEGRNWWAEAIKGDPNQLYPVINKYAHEDSTVQPYTYYGDVRNEYNDQEYMAGYRGLGITMYTIGFSLADDNYITTEDSTLILSRISSNAGENGSYSFSAQTQDELTAALKSVVSNMTTSATGAYYTDTMGANYDLYTGEPGQPDANGTFPYIKVLEYDVDEKGDRVSNEPINVLEIITFGKEKDEETGTETYCAYSDQINGGKTNIWNRENGLIRGRYVIYNTNKNQSVSLTLDTSGRTFSLAPETFFWIVGQLGSTEKVLDYQVYLVGSKDSTVDLPYERQYYDTNKEAKLNYINYLGNNCWLPTKTPKYPWGGGATEDVVVVDFGIPVEINVLSNDTQFDEPTLAGVTKGYDPQNSASGLNASDLKDKNGNTDTAAANVVFTTDCNTPLSGSYGKISIIEYTDDTDDTVKRKLKYTLNTMEFDGVEEFTYALQNHADGDEKYYFGKVKIIPATTIYYEDNIQDADGKSLITYEAYTYDITTVPDPEKPNKGITKLGADKWTTVVDKVLTDGEDIQAEDRPGDISLDSIDADNLYGYDGAYTTMSEYSLESARKFTASISGNTLTYGTATFTFTGTGFDIISLTSGQTGTITVKIVGTKTDSTTGKVYSKNLIVDTYYGYTYNSTTKKWEVSQNPANGTGVNTNTLYQVPVIKASEMPYDTYTVTITASYNDLFDHNQYGNEAKYDFYLDAIRIYDPADDGKNNSVIKDAYIADDEGWPEYFELRNLLITKGTFDSIGDSEDSVDGIVFIDGNGELSAESGGNSGVDGKVEVEGEVAQIADYKNFGPNNELYLAPGQAVAFYLAVPGTNTAKVASIQLAMKSVGGTATAKVYNAADTTYTSVTPTTIATATDLYYDITGLNNKTVVIFNESDSEAILSVTNIKVTYTAAHEDGITKSFFPVATKDIMMAVFTVADQMSSVGEQDPIEPVVGTIDVTSASLSFEDEILTNLYYTISDIEATEMGLLTWVTEPVEATLDSAENVYVGAEYDAEKGRYMVQTAGIAAKNLGDDIYMRVYAKTADGIIYSDVVTYSPKQYAMSRLEKSTSETMRALCVSMLNYGAAAQEYFGYKTDALMNSDLTAEQKALVSAYDAKQFTGAVAADANKIGDFAATSTGFSKKTATVSFDGAFAINYYFTADAEVAGDVTFYYWTADAYADAETMTAENASNVAEMAATEDGRYWLKISGIAAKQLDETFYVAAVYTDANGNSYCTGVIAYSLSQYCMNNADGNMGELAQTTAMYGYYAACYFNKEA